ncbi:MAG: DnaJ domain-containing protein [Candidatus Hodarchaeales archaeon]|jgi:molecular chaperone DnaJ
MINVSKAKRDYYEVLAVSRSASLEEIKKAYRKLALKHHPDNAKRKEKDVKAAEERFKEVGEAYAILSDTEKRKAYDRFGHSAFSGGRGPSGFDFGNIRFTSSGGGFDPFEIFSSFFGGGFEDVFGGGRRGRTRQQSNPFGGGFQGKPFSSGGFSNMSGQSTPPQPRKGDNVTIPLKLPEDEARAGISKNITQTVIKSGKKGKETIKLKIPAGIQNGRKLRLKGRGKPGKHGGLAGDLFVEIKIIPAVPQQQIFRINFIQSLLGGEVNIELPSGSQMLKLSEGVQNGQKFFFKGKGDLIGKSSIRKDLEVEIRIVMPSSLTQEQRTLVEELGKSLGML